MFDVLSYEIDIGTLQGLRDMGEVVSFIDVREPWEREICVLPGSFVF